MKKIVYYYNKLEESLLALSFIFSLGLIFIQVVMRTSLGSSLSWSEEMARYIFIWQCWLGVSLAERDNKHIRIEIVLSKLKPAARKYMELLILLLTLGTAVFLVWQGIKAFLFYFGTGMVSSALRIPMFFVYACLPVSCTLFGVRLVVRFVNIFLGKTEV